MQETPIHAAHSHRHRRRRGQGKAPGLKSTPISETRNPILNLESQDVFPAEENDMHFDVNQNMKLNLKRGDNFKGRDVSFDIHLPADLAGRAPVAQPAQHHPGYEP